MSIVAQFVLACLVLLALVGIDLVYLPGHNVPILFAVPILFVGLHWSPRLTIAVAAASLALDLLSLRLEPAIPETWILTFIVLTGIGYIATSISLTNQQRVERERRVAHAVQLAEQIRQPLTVIVARCQLMLREEPSAALEESLKAIERACRRVDRIVRELLETTEPVSSAESSRSSRSV